MNLTELKDYSDSWFLVIKTLIDRAPLRTKHYKHIKTILDTWKSDIETNIASIEGDISDLQGDGNIWDTIEVGNIIAKTDISHIPEERRLDITGKTTIDNELDVDIIKEYTSGAGVTIEDSLLKDGNITVNNILYTNTINPKSGSSITVNADITASIAGLSKVTTATEGGNCILEAVRDSLIEKDLFSAANSIDDTARFVYITRAGLFPSNKLSIPNPSTNRIGKKFYIYNEGITDVLITTTSYAGTYTINTQLINEQYDGVRLPSGTLAVAICISATKYIAFNMSGTLLVDYEDVS